MRYVCCPNLGLGGDSRRAHERHDLQVLPVHLDEQLDLLAIAVYRTDRRCAEVETVGEKEHLALVLLVPDHDAAQPG
jgi:hypothetical protein